MKAIDYTVIAILFIALFMYMDGNTGKINQNKRLIDDIHLKCIKDIDGIVLMVDEP